MDRQASSTPSPPSASAGRVAAGSKEPAKGRGAAILHMLLSQSWRLRTRSIQSALAIAGLMSLSTGLQTSSPLSASDLWLNESDVRARDALIRLVPPLTNFAHKGQMGRVGLLGGSADYTGAPYFASMASLRIGGDLAYVLTATEACLPIKSYSPELMVSPVYSSSWPEGREDGIEQMVTAVTDVLPRLHSLIVGPGLGRDESVFAATGRILTAARERRLPVVIDADGLFLISQDPDLIKGYELAVLTPNSVEFSRLRVAAGLADEKGDISTHHVKELARAMGNVTVVLKGERDTVSDGRNVLVCNVPGGLRRCGGLGDVLSGVIGTMVAWSAAAWRPEECESPSMWAAWWGCAVTKLATRAAYNEKKRSMGAEDALAHLGCVLEDLVPCEKVRPSL